jgi:hypothetical protein
MGAEKIKQKVIEAVRPHLDEREEVLAVFIGQTRIPPIAFMLIGPLLVLPIIQFKTFVVTDRNVYVFPNRWMRTYSYSGEPYKVAVADANVETGSMWLRVGGGPKVWSAPFGPVNKRRIELAETVRTAQAGGAPAEAAVT